MFEKLMQQDHFNVMIMCMKQRGHAIDIDQVDHVVERRWASGSPQHWAHRRLEIGRIIDVRWYVRLIDGVTHARAYPSQQQAEQAAAQIMATPNRIDEHPTWHELPGT